MKILEIFLLFPLLASIYGTKLNYPRVLLPIFDHITVNFTLEVVEKGCFKWTSSRLDLIHIASVYAEAGEDCSYRVAVTVINKEKRRSTAIVLAEDLSTGEVLRCDVILDVIDQLGVLTTTRELYLEEAPETFELWAQDAQGNAFTTLEGIEFNWQVSSQNYRNVDSKDSSWHQVLRFLTFAESKFHVVPKSIEKFEQLGVKGYMVLLEGINTGSAKVTVKLPHPEYSHVAPVQVNIMVLANLILNPSDVQILSGDSVQFQVLQLKQGKLHEISLNNQYYLEIEQKDLASIRHSEATGHKLGRTAVLLRDRNVPHDIDTFTDDLASRATLPKAFLTVVEPAKMSINLLPHYNWITVEGERHEIAIDLFTKDDYKITLGSKYKIKSTFDEKLYFTIKKTTNGSRIFGECSAVGSTPVTGLFENLNAKADMIIYKRIEIKPTEVIIPYDPNMKRHKIQFTASGGDGSFTWSSLDSSLIGITQTGVAETKLDNLKGISFGSADISKSTNIKVAMSRNNKISASASILFLPPIKLEIVSYNFETVLKDYVQVHIALHAYHNGTLKTFTSCENLSFDLDFSNQIFLLDPTQPGPKDVLKDGACRLFYLKSTNLGTTTLKITYKYFDKILSDQITLNVFDKLSILNPIENEIVLPIGASRNVIYFNGPEKIYNSEAELQKKIIYDTKNIDVVEIENNFSKEKHLVNVLCRKVGDYTIKLEIFNYINAKNVVPYVTEFITKVYCVKPRFLNLYTADKLKASCPLERKSSLRHVQTSHENLEVEIEVLDVHNRKLMNISSLLLEWKFTQTEVKNPVLYEQKTETDVIEGVLIPKRDFIQTSISDVNVNFKIKGFVTNYKLDVLKKYKITSEAPHFGIQKVAGGVSVTPIIENELSFLSVNRTLLPYDTVTLFLSKNDVERIQVSQGSGFYEIKTTDPSIVDVVFDENSRHLVITPKRIGEVKIEITDKCLMTDSSFLFVSVVTIGRIVVESPDRVEKTKTIEAIVKLFDNNENLLEIDNNNLQLYDLSTEIFNPNILNVALGHQNNLNVGEIRFIITGTELGETKIVANSGVGEKITSSAPSAVQVFPPLTLLPRNATIIVGSKLQVYSRGGPSPDTNIVYSAQHQDIISIDSGVVLGLKIGESKVVGKCIGVNPSTGQQIVFSEDVVTIHVIPLVAIEIKTPLNRIKSGATMPGNIWGLPNVSPMILGTLESVKIFWSTDNPNVVDIRNVFHGAGIEYEPQDKIAVRLTALSPGEAQIHVVFVTPSGVKLTAKTEVTVFKLLELESPKTMKFDSILIPPRSSIQLKANLDDAVFELENDSSVVKVSKSGLVQSGDVVGRNQIIASSSDQSLTVPIEVKNIHYILTSLEATNIKLKTVESKIPQGFSLTLKVSLHDNLGNEFSHNLEDVGALKHKLSKKESVDVSIGMNYTINLNLDRSVSNMMVVSLKDKTGVKFSEDYFKISVAESMNIFPITTSFSVGDIICFESPLLENAQWTSSDDSIVSVDSSSGIAHILSKGHLGVDEKVHVLHGDQRGGNVKFGLEIKDADKIEFFKTYDIFNGEKYRGHLVMKNRQQIDKLTNVIAKNVSTCSLLINNAAANFFSCKLTSKQSPNNSILKKFKTYPSFDEIIGAYTCDVELLTTIDEIAGLLKNNELNVDLEARLMNGISGSITLRIVPGIMVSPEVISIDQISQHGVTIIGLDKILQKIEVTSSHPSSLKVSLYEKAPGSVQYKLQLLSSYAVDLDQDLFVNIKSPLTQQVTRIPILSPNSIRKCSNQPLSNMPNMILNYVSNFGLLISALVVVAATVWVFVFCFPQRHKSDPNVTVFSPFKNENLSPTSPYDASLNSRGSNLKSSPYNLQGSMSQSSNTSGGYNSSDGEGSPIYGDTSLISPQKRINRRYL